MKTAKEWNDEPLDQNLSTLGYRLAQLRLIEAIQLDAFKAGMKEAAENCSGWVLAEDAKKSILAAIDSNKFLLSEGPWLKGNTTQMSAETGVTFSRRATLAYIQFHLYELENDELADIINIWMKSRVYNAHVTDGDGKDDDLIHGPESLYRQGS